MTKITKGISLMASAACFSAMLLMTSCSKENAVTPDSAGKNESSNLRQEGPSIIPVYHFPSTDGPTCVGCKPNNWYFKLPARDATSSLTAYAGNPSKNWVQPLSEPLTGTGSIITVVNDATYAGEASAVIKNLTKGKKYKLTFSVSTTSLNEANGPTPYASDIKVAIENNSPAYIDNYLVEKTIDFTNKKNQWITETIEFEAKEKQLSFHISGHSPKGETKLTYANFHVGPNAVHRID